MSKLGGALAATVIGLFSLPIYAHHLTGAELPYNVLYGVLSGIGHPLIGITHLIFMLGVGLLFALQPVVAVSRVMLFLAATWMGALGHLLGLDIPAVEQMMALGIVVAGLMLVWKRAAVLPCVLALSAAAGTLHGFAYAEDIVGARTGPLLGYFFGFTLIQALVLLSTVMVVRKLRRGHAGNLVRLWEWVGGGILAGLGLLLLAI
jgi:urease accessory protein